MSADAARALPPEVEGGRLRTVHRTVGHPVSEVMDLVVERRDDGATTVTVSGEVDMLTAPALRSTVDEEHAAGGSLLVIDLRGVTFLGSSGLSVLVHARRLGEDAGTALRLVAASRVVLHPLEAAGLRPLFDVVDAPADAIG